MNRESKYAESFCAEANEILNDIEAAALNMEETPNDQECIHRLFRSMHTIKGSGSMFGFNDMAELAHHAETLLDKVREGTVPVTAELIDLILLAKDQIKAMLDADKTGYKAAPSLNKKIIRKLNRLLPESKTGETALPPKVVTGSDETMNANKETVFRIRFRPNRNVMVSGLDPVTILDELGDLGKCELMANINAIPTLAELVPDNIFFSWDIILTTTAGINAVKDVFIFVDEGSEVAVQAIEKESIEDDTAGPRPGATLVGRGNVDEGSVNDVLKKRKRIDEMPVESGHVANTGIKSALMEQKLLEKRGTESDVESVRISSEKLDKLINLVGEIVVTQAHMSHLAENHQNTVFSLPIKQMERLSGDLRKIALNMRMLPVGTLFRGFKRLVRDLSSELGKEVELVVEGGQTELDKTILEKLHDPLVHLIRNSLDHGMHLPEKREQLGKPRRGTIRLTAVHKGAKVNIRVADDGMGIDLEKVRAKAMQNGMGEDKELSESEIHELLFSPGFSTAGEVTGISGRGVGMDVVKQAIDSLGGTIEIESVQGGGTIFHMSLPLTLAIIEGLHVRVDARDFVIPVSQVEICDELKWKRLAKDEPGARNMVRVKGKLIPFIRLRDFFGFTREKRPVEHMAAIQAEYYRIGVVVDEILGNIQTVIKPLDPLYGLAEGISGATVMGDGTVALIVDLRELVRCVKKDGKKSMGIRASMTG